MKHLLTIKIPVDGMDTLDAREQATHVLKDMLSEMDYMKGKVEVKLQRIFDNKPPVKVTLDVPRW